MFQFGALGANDSQPGVCPQCGASLLWVGRPADGGGSFWEFVRWEMGDGRWGMGVSTVGTRRLETFSNLIDSHCQKRKKSPFLPLFSHRQPQDLLSPSGS